MLELQILTAVNVPFAGNTKLQISCHQKCYYNGKIDMCCNFIFFLQKKLCQVYY